MSLTKKYADGGGGKVPRRLKSGIIVMERPFGGRATPYHEQDANGAWAKHYEAWLELDRLTTDYTISAIDRREARRAMVVCQRKLDHWSRHANYDTAQAARDAARLKLAARR